MFWPNLETTNSELEPTMTKKSIKIEVLIGFDSTNTVSGLNYKVEFVLEVNTTKWYLKTEEIKY